MHNTSTTAAPIIKITALTLNLLLYKLLHHYTNAELLFGLLGAKLSKIDVGINKIIMYINSLL